MTNSEKRQALAATVTGVAAAAIFLLFLVRSDVAIDYMKLGLKLCANTVIPSLFPFTVVSAILVNSGVALRLCRPLALPSRLIFGVSEGGACAFLIGTVCGFPLGAKALCNMYDRGLITKSEFERVLTFCNNPGSAFVISAVGLSLFGSVRIGVTLYVCMIISAVLVGFFSRFFLKKQKGVSASPEKITVGVSSTGVSLFTDAVKDSALSTLTVCAMIAFFSSLTGCIGATLSRLGVSELPIALFSAFFEMSGGVSALSTFSPKFAVVLSAAALGWSGLSVHFQVTSLCSGRGISFKPYFAAKALQSLLGAALTAIALKALPIESYAFSDFSKFFLQNGFSSDTVFFWGVISVALFLSGAVCFWKKSRGQKKRKKR